MAILAILHPEASLPANGSLLTSVSVKGFSEVFAARKPQKSPFLRARCARKNGHFSLSKIQVLLQRNYGAKMPNGLHAIPFKNPNLVKKQTRSAFRVSQHSHELGFAGANQSMH
ncbi:hypothetical protein ACQ4M4_06615 [Leptolyngbya sp. AN02str]|uniref:hypothetical protein n=1 Tax=Leptolyngbya sp. AN02str TaxID=3423363 RepID=UPI003D317323